MTIWLRRSNGTTSKVLRQAVSNSSVDWSPERIEYCGIGVGLINENEKEKENENDTEKIKDELEKLLGYRPVEIDDPTTDQSNQPQ
jgi:glycine betaine/choline ABC-type transport system substrate-binding protein